MDSNEFPITVDDSGILHFENSIFCLYPAQWGRFYSVLSPRWVGSAGDFEGNLP